MSDLKDVLVAEDGEIRPRKKDFKKVYEAIDMWNAYGHYTVITNELGLPAVCYSDWLRIFKALHDSEK